MRKGDLRILGASDAYAQMIVLLKQHIGAIEYHRIPDHHRRKQRARRAILSPLREILSRAENSHKECRQAYEHGFTDAELEHALQWLGFTLPAPSYAETQVRQMLEDGRSLRIIKEYFTGPILSELAAPRD